LFAIDEEKRSIGDVVQGLHGSKYQFNEAGLNFEGQQFAEMGYSSGVVETNDFEKDPMPEWALKLRESQPPSSCPALVIQRDGSTFVEIRNEERSWEMLYAFVIGSSAGTTIVQPWVGQLAPRGGTNRYSDSVRLEVKSSDLQLVENSWLVVGTEAEKWFYRLVVG
jgi:hypothetical protein